MTIHLPGPATTGGDKSDFLLVNIISSWICSGGLHLLAPWCWDQQRHVL